MAQLPQHRRRTILVFADPAHRSAIDGDRTGRARCNHHVWNDDAPANTFPDWLQIDFNGSKTITEIDVITVQDHIE
jgi:hypothetical protein